MRIIAEQREALVGRQINLSTQELIALKDKWEKMEQVLEAYSTPQDSISKAVKVTQKALDDIIPLLEDINNFLSQLTDGVQSTSEVHDELFMSEREKELAEAQTLD